MIHVKSLVPWTDWGWKNNRWIWAMESAKLGKLLSVGVGAKGFVLAWSPGRAGGDGMRFGGHFPEEGVSL